MSGTGVTTLLSAASAASGASAEIDVSGNEYVNVQLVGAGFTGTVTISQGAASGALGATKALTLTDYTGATEYYALNPSTKLQVSYTRSAGTLTAYAEAY
jgi:hypothetical protein